nr:hypothetical protein [Streptomyces sp. W9]
MEDTGVTNTPTRRPNTRTDPRRPTKEHRMPRRPYNPKIHADLTTAASLLRDTNPDLATSIDKVTAPGGWEHIRPDTTRPNVPIRLTTALKAQIEERTTDIAGDINEGLTEYLAGRFNPDAPVRARRNSGATEDQTIITPRPDPELVQQVKDTAEERSASLGWKPNVSAVALAWLRHKHGI